MSDYRPIRVGDIVRWHDITCDWTVAEIHRNGMLTIETEIVDGETTRTERRQARQRDCRVVGQQLSLDLTAEERDLILLVRAEQAKRDARGPTDDMEDPDDEAEPPRPDGREPVGPTTSY